MEGSIDALLERMGSYLTPMVEQGDERRHFLATYMRTSAAIQEEIRSAREGGFGDPDWVERWLLTFADMYVDALRQWNEEGSAPPPWQAVFRADDPIAPTRQVLLSASAHIQYDFPQALLQVISDERFEDRRFVAARRRDHEHMDRIIARRASEEDRLLREAERRRGRSVTDWAISSIGGQAAVRLLRDARSRVWHNAAVLSRARRAGAAELKAGVDRLGSLSAARIEYMRGAGRSLTKIAREAPQVLLEG